MTLMRDLVQDAFRKCGILAKDEQLEAEDLRAGVRSFNSMVRGWQSKGIDVFGTASMSVTMTTAISYALSPMPVRVHSVRFKRNGSELQMSRMTRDEYDSLPVKTSTGTPTSWYLDRQANAATLYVWQGLAAAAGETLELTYERAFAEVGATDLMPLPPEWEDAALYGLADRLCEDYEVGNLNPMLSDRIAGKAMMFFRAALASDREGSVFMHEPCE